MQRGRWADVVGKAMHTDMTTTGPEASSDPTLYGEAQIARLFEMTSDLLAAISLDGRFTLLNPAWEQVLGWTIEELQAQPMQELVHPDDIEQTLVLTLAGNHRPAQFVNFTNRYRHRDGSWRWLLWSARCDGEAWYAAAKDVTDRMWLERQALHDPLTKLPNRLLLMDRARQAVARLRRSNGPIALLFIDLDRFKAINDSLGHAVGDHLLISVSERLAEMLRDSDTVARLGGDEFVILAEDLDSDAEALAVAERVLHALEEPFQVGSAEVSMLASVGVSISHDPEAEPEDLLREADVAMYRAKGAGGHNLELFNEDLRREADARLELEDRLEHALPRHELLLEYQPLLPLSGGRPVGCEALVRWHPHGGEPLPPLSFLSLAEESERIVQIGDWVLHTACAQAATWRRDGIEMTISVNVSARELTGADLAERVHEALLYCRLPGRALCLEVSEEVVLRDPARARAALKEVRSLGVAVALDNFGARQLNAQPAGQPAAEHAQARPHADPWLRAQQRQTCDGRGDARARPRERPDRRGHGDRNQPAAGARARAGLLGGTGLPPAQAGRAGAAAPQRGARDDTLARTMAPDRATARRKPPLSDSEPRARAFA